MNYPKEQSAAFTGHRFISAQELLCIKEQLNVIIRGAYAHGIRNFYCGMAIGFDMFCAQAICDLRTELPDIRLTAVVPFRKQSERFTDSQKSRYDMLISAADDVIILNEDFHKGCYMQRNNYMVDRSNLIIAYSKGAIKGGTYHTCKRAKSKGIPIINLCLL